ncbi:hypothetical protein BC833DRAFT_566722 [Globomyces pollinis-pini]|nr:hypothetical protein BC833DRAFT_566722 [Globomyces pollinis-pini]
MFKITYIILEYAAAISIIESQWKGSFACDGEPNSIYQFNISSLDAFRPNENEKWASFFEMTVQEYTLGYCGNMIPLNFDQCCYSSLDLNASMGYKSGSPRILTNLKSVDYAAPVSANGKQYCKVIPIELEGLKGFESVYILADNSCFEEYYKCTQDGHLMVFSEKDCSGSKELIELSSSKNTFATSKGNFEGAIHRFQNGTQSYTWTALTPSANLIPNTDSLWDQVCQFAMIVTLCFFVGTLFFIVWKFKVKRNRIYIIRFITQLLWIGSGIIWLYYINQIFDTFTNLVTVQQLDGAFQGLATLSTVIQTAYQLFQFQLPFCPESFRYPLYTILVAIHFLFFGGNYFQFCLLKTITVCLSDITMYNWRAFTTYWIAFMFIWNIVPVLLAGMFIKASQTEEVTGGKKSKCIKSLFIIDSWFFALVLLQALLTLIYIVLGSILNYTTILGNDRASICIRSVQRALIGFHGGLHLAILERWVVGVRKLQTIHSFEKSAPMNKTTGVGQTGVGQIDRNGVSEIEITPRRNEIE